MATRALSDNRSKLCPGSVGRGCRTKRRRCPGIGRFEHPARAVERVAENDDPLANTRDGQTGPDRRAAMRSSSGGWVMNSFLSPAALPPEMPKAAILSGSGPA
jgi:hypothetical protein